MIYKAILHVNPLANSHVPRMTITRTIGSHWDYKAVNQDLSIIDNQEKLKELFHKKQRC